MVLRGHFSPQCPFCPWGSAYVTLGPLHASLCSGPLSLLELFADGPIEQQRGSQRHKACFVGIFWELGEADLWSPRLHV